MNREQTLLRRIRILVSIVVAGLVLSGLTAFAIESELRWLTQGLGVRPDARPAEFSGLLHWLVTVRDAVVSTNAQYPFMAYATDWLAFAHLVIAVAFLGVIRDPVRNAWVVDFGLISCAGVLALAFLAGEARGIPMYWRFVDSSFGVGCAVPLLLARRYIAQLQVGDRGTVSRHGIQPPAGAPAAW